MLRHTKKSRRSVDARAAKLRLESLEERQLLTAVGWEAAATSEQVPYGPEFCVVCDERCEPAIDLTAMQNESASPLDLAESYSILKTTEDKSFLTVTSTEDSDTPGTLRYAIANAAEGDAITFADNLKDQTITLTQGELKIEKVLTIDASSLYDEATNTPGITIDAGGKSRVAYISAGTTDAPVLFNGLTLQNGYAEQGGGVYVRSSGTFMLTNSTISGNSAKPSGGGVYVGEYGAFTSTNSMIADNSASCGGGVYVDGYGTFTSTNSTIDGNSAFCGGGVHVYSGTFTSTNSTIDGNSATLSAAGGVCVDGYGTFTSTNSTISGNSAKTSGGGVYVYVGTFTSTNSTIDGNSASSGGGVYVYYGGTFTSTNSTISGNSASSGGGVYVISGISGTFTSTNSILSLNYGSNLDGNLSASSTNNLIDYSPLFVCAPVFDESGVLTNGDSLDLRLRSDSPAIDKGDDQSAYDAGLTVDSTDMAGESRFSGAAIDIGAYEYHVPLTSVSIIGGGNVGETLSAKAYSDFGEVESATYVWTLDGVEISDDYVVSLFDVGKTLTVEATGTGGYAGTVESSLTIAAPSEVVIDPTPENFVQAVKVAVDGGTITFAPSDDPQTIYVESPILIENKSLTIDGTGANIIFDGGNVAPVAAAPLRTSGDDHDGEGTHRLFEVKAGEVLNLTNVTIQNGFADYGGAIKNAGTLTLDGVTFQNNEATKNGGAIFNDFGATLTINGGSFSGNSANNGGAIANYAGENGGGSTTIADVAFKSNTAKRFGGAYFGCGELTVDGETSFTSNDAGIKGGAIYNDVNKSDVNNPYVGVVTINGSDVLFEANTAGERGGAIQTYSTLDVGGTATFSGNQANGEIYERYGGAIDVGEGGSATLSGSLTFNDNAADFGGAIFSVQNLTFGSDGDYAFKGNVADQSGGAIDALAGTLTLGGSFAFTSNKANGTYVDDSEDCWDKTGLGGALAIATSAENTTVDGAKFVWSGNFAENGYGNCVAFKNDCGISAETFGLEDAADYVMFDELVENVNSLQSLLPRSISPNAVEATIMIEGVKTTFGAEGVTPQQLGLGVGTHEALVQYVDANGETSATYVLKLTVVPGASVEVRETAIADGRGVKFDFNLTKADGGAVSVWEISWGDGSTTRSDNLSESWLAAHYYAQDGTFDVSLKVVYIDGTSETFEAFSTQKIGATVAKTEALSAVFEDVDDLFEDAFVEFENPRVYGPAFLR